MSGLLRIGALVLVAAALGCGKFIDVPRPLAPRAAFDIYAASPSASAGATSIVDSATGTTYYLAAPPIVTAIDIGTVQRSGTDANLTLTVELKPTGAAALSAATTRPASTHLAILINGVVVSVPMIRSPLSSGFVIAGGGVHRDRDSLFRALTEP